MNYIITRKNYLYPLTNQNTFLSLSLQTCWYLLAVSMTLINRTWHFSIFSYPPACIQIVIGRYCQKSLLIIVLGKSQYFIIPSLQTSWFGWDCQKRLTIELGTSQYFLIPSLCQVRLIGDPDHTYQFKHVYRLGIRKHWDAPRTIDNRSHIYPFQHVCRERIRKY